MGLRVTGRAGRFEEGRVGVEQNFTRGERVMVNDPALASLRDIMRNATGDEPKPNHHGTVYELWPSEEGVIEEDRVLIYFDDGGSAPYLVSETEHLDEPALCFKEDASGGICTRPDSHDGPCE